MSDLRADPASSPDPLPPSEGGAPDAPRIRTLRGTALCPGRVGGRLRVVRDAFGDGRRERIPAEAVEDELNRFRRALERSREQLVDLRARLTDRVGDDDARVLDTHIALSKDSAFIADVESQILDEHLALESAIGKVVGDFDRIFRLVDSEHLRRSAADLRDVGLRVLRNLEQAPDAVPDPTAGEAPVILVAAELSVIDLLDLTHGRAVGVVVEQPDAATHAAILARSLRVPTLVGVDGALDQVEEGQWGWLDVEARALHVADEARLLAPLREAAVDAGAAELHADALTAPHTADGVGVELLPACGSASEAERAAGWGAPEVGLYRTELSFLLESRAPSADLLETRYREVCEAAGGRRVTFRLFQADSTAPLAYLDLEREPNPALGCAGVRLLREHPELLRAQLGALLRVGHEHPLRIAIPFVDDLDQFAFVRDVLAAERLDQRRAGREVAGDVELGVVLDTPAALLGLDTLCDHADFLIFHLDSLTQYVLAADRSQPRFATAFERLHPYLLRALHLGLQAVRTSGVEFSAAGGIAERTENLSHLVGLGFRRLCVGTHALPALLETLGSIDLESAEEKLDAARRAPSARRERSPVAGYRHGLA